MHNKLKIATILNVTPDSFSDGGQFFDFKSAINRGIEMLEKGVDIIDIGGESTRPGAMVVDSTEEIRRTIPVIKELLLNFPKAVISIDTTKSEVAEEALKHGATIINDVSGGSFDPRIWEVTAGYGAKYILMHTSGTPDIMQTKTTYTNVVSDVKNYLFRQAEEALKSGINEVIIDPGIGFGKTAEQNITLIKNIHEFTESEFEVMIGLSRKSFIGKIFSVDINQRDFHSSLFEFYSVINGASYIRTHNIENAVTIKKVWNSLNV